MKKYIYLLLATLFLFYASCDLGRDPLGQFSEKTIAKNDSGNGIKFETKAEMQTQYDALYTTIRSAGQEKWVLDFLVHTDTHSDNAYSGGSGNNLVTLEKLSQDAGNGIIERDWNTFLGHINTANSIICNVDAVPDPALTATERKRWKSEALVFRAWIMFDMARLWGDIPIVTEETPEITVENLDEMYPLLYPPRKPIAEVYVRIIQDLEEALEEGGVPAVDPSNKFLFTKPVAKALLAKVYAEVPARDYGKVIEYCQAVENDGFELMENYGDLFAVNEARTDVKHRSSKESIFEMTYPLGSGNWLSSMYGIDLLNPNGRYDWAKYLTPSRDLIRAFQNEGDHIRMEETMIFGNPSWTNHYQQNEPLFYPFMFKIRSKYNSVIKIRLADILLLKAEAHVELNQLSEAAILVNRIRERVHLAPLPPATVASLEKMREAVLHERRLELAFEGHRWFDLVRTGKVYEVMNTLNNRDEGRRPMEIIDEKTVFFPVPQTQIDKNPNLIQNPGY